MPADRDGGAAVTFIGRFAVSVSPEHVVAFAAALGADTGNKPQSIPASYPISWLGQDDVRAAFRQALDALPGADTRVPVHLSQTISYDRDLVPGADYWLELEVAGPDARQVLRLDGTIRDADGARHAVLAGRLALVSAGAPEQ